MKKGFGFIIENCKDEGLLFDILICENIVLFNLFSFFLKGFIDYKWEVEFVDFLIKCFIIKMVLLEMYVCYLLGGN